MTTMTPVKAEPDTRPAKARHNAAWASDDHPRTGMMAQGNAPKIDGAEQRSFADAAWPVWRAAGLTR